MNEVELARALEDMGDVKHLPHLGVDARILRIGRRADAASFAAVALSCVANKVTSMPRATSASVNRLVTNSHGP